MLQAEVARSCRVRNGLSRFFMTHTGCSPIFFVKYHLVVILQDRRIFILLCWELVSWWMRWVRKFYCGEEVVFRFGRYESEVFPSANGHAVSLFSCSGSVFHAWFVGFEYFFFIFFFSSEGILICFERPLESEGPMVTVICDQVSGKVTLFDQFFLREIRPTRISRCWNSLLWILLVWQDEIVRTQSTN